MADVTLDEFQIARLDLQKGDALVIRAPVALSEHQRRQLRNMLDGWRFAAGWECPVLVLEAGMDIAVVRGHEVVEADPQG